MTLPFVSANRYDPKKAFKKKIWVVTTHKKIFRAHEVHVCGKLKLSFWSLLKDFLALWEHENVKMTVS